MEVKGMMDRIDPVDGLDFIGRKCLKFLEPQAQNKKTVSIVPIIGEYRSLPGNGDPAIGDVKGRSDLRFH